MAKEHNRSCRPCWIENAKGESNVGEASAAGYRSGVAGGSRRKRMHFDIGGTVHVLGYRIRHHQSNRERLSVSSADQRSREVFDALRKDDRSFDANVQKLWDSRPKA